MEDNDVLLQQKKRARRRLVGALAFVSMVAVVLPMVMEHEPRQSLPDVDIRIPGQDEKPFAPRLAMMPPEKAAAGGVDRTDAPPAMPLPEASGSDGASNRNDAARVLAAEKTGGKVGEKASDRVADKSAEKLPSRQDKPVDRPAEKAPEKPGDKAADKPDDRAAAARVEEARRAAALLEGQSAEPKPVAKAGDYLILIGAFANEGNVKILKSKLGELGIKVISEPLETPQGRKTRVRAGPFAGQEAAEKALEKMKRVGVSGVIAAKP